MFVGKITENTFWKRQIWSWLQNTAVLCDFVQIYYFGETNKKRRQCAVLCELLMMKIDQILNIAVLMQNRCLPQQ